MSISNLFTKIQIGPYQLPNRIVMAPMTRNRAGNENVPTALMAQYYKQRSSAGLIITEATQVTPEGVGYPNTPGIHSDEQVEGWKQVTKAVHESGGRIFLQLWHVGRISHPLLLPKGMRPVAPSAIAPQGQVYTPEGMKPYEIPRPLETNEISRIIEQYIQGAKNALRSGFDGVELHGANGYLIDQFLRDGTNIRTDIYGGSIENRARFLLEVTKAVIDIWGSNRVGVRLSPSGTFNDMKDSHPLKTFSYAVKELKQLGIVYIHIIETSEADKRHEGNYVETKQFRPLFDKVIIVNGGYNRERADAAIKDGTADMVSFGVLFLANPDLPHRLNIGAPLNIPDPDTFYGGGEKGYIDYPIVK